MSQAFNQGVIGKGLARLIQNALRCAKEPACHSQLPLQQRGFTIPTPTALVRKANLAVPEPSSTRQYALSSGKGHNEASVVAFKAPAAVWKQLHGHVVQGRQVVTAVGQHVAPAIAPLALQAHTQLPGTQLWHRTFAYYRDNRQGSSAVFTAGVMLSVHGACML